jgi:uncharacterized protein YecE (DUF72 family)
MSNFLSGQTMIHLGLPVWSNKDWRGSFFTDDAEPESHLQQYASVFNAVEGNTTFYGIPTAATVQKWLEQAPKDFRFCFKMPKAITHDSALQRCDVLVREFLKRMEPLAPVMGPMMIQLPAAFAPQHMEILQRFLGRLPMSFRYAVEVRHADFFTLGVVSDSLDRMLENFKVERVNFDSRALFSCRSDDAEVLDAQRKKPQLPYHCHALGKTPLLRFIGHPDVASNDGFFEPWVATIAQWLREGRQPFVFFHMANRKWSPQLAFHLHERLRAAIDLPALTSAPVERVPKAAATEIQLDLF